MQRHIFWQSSRGRMLIIQVDLCMWKLGITLESKVNVLFRAFWTMCRVSRRKNIFIARIYCLNNLYFKYKDLVISLVRGTNNDVLRFENSNIREFRNSMILKIRQALKNLKNRNILNLKILESKCKGKKNSSIKWCSNKKVLSSKKVTYASLSFSATPCK